MRRIRPRARTLIAAIAALLLLPRAAAAVTASYHQEVEFSDQLIHSTVFYRDGLVRLETAGEDQLVVYIANAEGIFRYVEHTQEFERVPSLNIIQWPIDGLDDYPAYLRAHNARYLGTDVVNRRYPCDVYEFVTDTGVATAWVWRDRQFPVRLRREEQTGVMVAELSHVKVNAHLGDALFQLPPEVRLKGADAVDTFHIMKKRLWLDQ